MVSKKCCKDFDKIGRCAVCGAFCKKFEDGECPEYNAWADELDRQAWADLEKENCEVGCCDGRKENAD